MHKLPSLEGLIAGLRAAKSGMIATAVLLALAAIVVPKPGAAQIPGMNMQQMAGPAAGAAAVNNHTYAAGAGTMLHVLQGSASPMLKGSMMADPNMNVAAAATRGEPGNAAAAPPESGTEAPEVPDVGEGFWEVLVGSCAGGAFIGAFSVISAASAAPAAAAAAPPAAVTAVLGAMGIGCALGMATASTSYGAIKTLRYVVN